MTIFFILTIGTLTILLSYKLFGKWFNHITIYSFVWMTILYLYELRLIYFKSLTINTWLVIISAFISFLIGSILIFSIRSTKIKSEESRNDVPLIVSDNGKTLKFFIFLFSIIGILSALQHWQVLLNKYGTVLNIFLNAYHIYKERAGGELEGVVPYVWLIIYPTIFLAGLYTAYKNKLTIVTLLPFIALIIKEIANLSRAGILYGFAEFIASFMLARHFMKNRNPGIKKSNYKVVFGILILVSLLIFGVVFVKTIRKTTDSFKGTSTSLSQLEGGAFISPSIYFYGASQVVVLNQFLEADKENLPFGSNTFFTIYRILARFDFVKAPPFIDRGYFTPSWSNTGTYLREVYNDFGYVGIFVIPFLLGLLCTFYWFKFYENGKLVHLMILTHLYIIIIMSFFVYQVRSPRWTIGGILLLIIIPFVEKIVQRNQKLI